MKTLRIAPPAIALLSALAVAAPALAAVPANDTYAGRTPLAAAPVTVTADTSGATTDADDDALNSECGAPAMDASVWYSYTATADGALIADVSESAYSAGVFVATGAPGSFEVLGCAPGATAWEATAGETYSIVVIDDQSDETGNGGAMSLTVDEAPPVPEVDLTVASKATFTKAGNLLLSGTVTCTAGAVTDLDASVTQTVGRLKIEGYGYTSIDCGDGSTQPWTMEIVGANGVFKGGKAASVTFAYACGAFDCGVDYEEHTIAVSGGKR